VNDEYLFENTKVAAYFLWEYTGCDQALALWYCAEDLAAYFERKNYLQTSEVYDIMRENIYDIRRVAFVRHIAYRIHVYTGNHDKLANWYAAERLLDNGEWLSAVCAIASVYHENKKDFAKLTGVRSEQVKHYYIDAN
jgi:hypothetical protein